MIGAVTSRSRLPLLINIAVKLLLAGLLVFAMTHLELPRLAGKAMGARAVFYPVFALIVPIGWMLRGRRPPYPYLADTFMVMPAIIDVAGNVLDLYNTIVWFDDIAHAVTWMFLVLAVGSLILRLGLAPWNAGALAIGFGAVSHILWEIIEWLVMEIGAEGLQLTYGDTIGDLGLSLSGSVIAGVITGWRAARQRTRH